MSTIFDYTKRLERPITRSYLLMEVLDVAQRASFDSGYVYSEPFIETVSQKDTEGDIAHVLTWVRDIVFSRIMVEENRLSIICLIDKIVIETHRAFRKKQTGELLEEDFLTSNSVENITQHDKESVERAKIYLANFLREEWIRFYEYKGNALAIPTSRPKASFVDKEEIVKPKVFKQIDIYNGVPKELMKLKKVRIG